MRTKYLLTFIIFLFSSVIHAQFASFDQIEQVNTDSKDYYLNSLGTVIVGFKYARGINSENKINLQGLEDNLNSLQYNFDKKKYKQTIDSLAKAIKSICSTDNDKIKKKCSYTQLMLSDSLDGLESDLAKQVKSKAKKPIKKPKSVNKVPKKEVKKIEPKSSELLHGLCSNDVSDCHKRYYDIEPLDVKNLGFKLQANSCGESPDSGINIISDDGVSRKIYHRILPPSAGNKHGTRKCITFSRVEKRKLDSTERKVADALSSYQCKNAQECLKGGFEKFFVNLSRISRSFTIAEKRKVCKNGLCPWDVGAQCSRLLSDLQKKGKECSYGFSKDKVDEFQKIYLKDIELHGQDMGLGEWAVKNPGVLMPFNKFAKSYESYDKLLDQKGKVNKIFHSPVFDKNIDKLFIDSIWARFPGDFRDDPCESIMLASSCEANLEKLAKRYLPKKHSINRCGLALDELGPTIDLGGKVVRTGSIFSSGNKVAEIDWKSDSSHIFLNQKKDGKSQKLFEFYGGGKLTQFDNGQAKAAVKFNTEYCSTLKWEKPFCDKSNDSKVLKLVNNKVIENYKCDAANFFISDFKDPPARPSVNRAGSRGSNKR